MNFANLGIQRITGAALAQWLALLGILGVRVTSLDHETRNNPVKQQIVVKALIGQLNEVGFVLRSTVVQLYLHIAVFRLYKRIGSRILVATPKQQA